MWIPWSSPPSLQSVLVTLNTGCVISSQAQFEMGLMSVPGAWPIDPKPAFPSNPIKAASCHQPCPHLPPHPLRIRSKEPGQKFYPHHRSPGCRSSPCYHLSVFPPAASAQAAAGWPTSLSFRLRGTSEVGPDASLPPPSSLLTLSVPSLSPLSFVPWVPPLAVPVSET